jgi:hypothetical protein
MQFGDRRIFIKYRDDGRGLPEWAAPTLRSLSERWGMEPGWDTYNAEPTDARLAGKLFGYLLTLMHGHSTPPVITPLSDGGLQAEWHHNNQHLEIVVSADDAPAYFYSNPANHQEEEHELEQSFSRVRDLISRF